MELNSPFQVALPNNFLLSGEIISLSDEIKTDIFNKKYSPNFIAFIAFDNLKNIFLRNWKSGDFYQPIGFKENSKIHNIFINKKIDSCLRHELPFILFNDEIVWIPTLPPSENFKITPSTKKALKIIYKKL